MENEQLHSTDTKSSPEKSGVTGTDTDEDEKSDNSDYSATPSHIESKGAVPPAADRAESDSVDNSMGTKSVDTAVDGDVKSGSFATPDFSTSRIGQAMKRFTSSIHSILPLTTEHDHSDSTDSDNNESHEELPSPENYYEVASVSSWLIADETSTARTPNEGTSIRIHRDTLTPGGSIIGSRHNKRTSKHTTEDTTKCTTKAGTGTAKEGTGTAKEGTSTANEGTGNANEGTVNANGNANGRTGSPNEGTVAAIAGIGTADVAEDNTNDEIPAGNPGGRSANKAIPTNDNIIAGVHYANESTLYTASEGGIRSSTSGNEVTSPPNSMHMRYELAYKMEKMPIYADGEHVDYKFKIIVVGDPGVGKTSLIERFSRSHFCYGQVHTAVGIRVGEYYRVIALENGKRVKLELWDTGGTERQFSLSLKNKSSFLRATKGDKHSHSNREGFKTWIKELRYRLDDARATIIILVGNKNDIKKREVSKKDASEFAEKNNFDYIETSSKEDNNVDQLFFLICQRLLEKKFRGKSLSRPNIVANVSVANSRNRSKSSCCCCFCRN